MTQSKFFHRDFVEEEGRQDIYHWSERRERKYKGFRKSIHVFQIFAFNSNLLRSFIKNFNFMVILQMAFAGLVTYACKSLNIVYDVHVSLFISPIVFPLAFSINTDFQRREKVLEDLANFKSSAMMWLFCMRDWRVACCFDDAYMKAVGNKIKGMLFHLREYLLTEKLERRKFIARIIYEDLSDANQFNEKVRSSDLTANSPLVSRIIHFLNMMCLSYERLRVIREYRSPRSIRSFTKVLIFMLPILLSPYHVYLGNKDGNSWSPYYISIMVAFVFGALQGVQDKLDDPFDGMSEDDIKLDTLDEWTFQSLEATVHRTYKIGRFQVSSNPENEQGTNIDMEQFDGALMRKKSFICKDRAATMKEPLHRFYAGAKSPLRLAQSRYSEEDSNEELEHHPYAGVLHNITGNTTIRRGGHIKQRQKSFDDLYSLCNSPTRSRAIPFTQVVFGGNNSSQINLRSSTNTPTLHSRAEVLHSLFNVGDDDHVSLAIQETPLTSCDVASTAGYPTENIPMSGVPSYLASIKNKADRYSCTSSRNSNSSIGSRARSSRNSLPDDKSKSFIDEGENLQTADLQLSKLAPQSRFNVFNLSSASTDPLLNSSYSIDSDTFSSNEDELKKRSHSVNNFNHVEQPFSRAYSYSGNTKNEIPVNSSTLKDASKSESRLYQELKEEEIFI